MHVDDRLATVLGARVESVGARRIQYRQLIDIVGTSAAGARNDSLDAAFVRLAELARELPVEDRARALAEPGVRLRNPRLVADLAGDAPPVAVAAIRAARLDDAQWIDLIPALPLAARGLLRHRRDLGPEVSDRLERLGIGDRGLPPAEGQAKAEPETPSAQPAAPAEPSPPPPRLAVKSASPERNVPGDGIGALVRRIEAFRRSRQGAVPPPAANDAPRLPLGEREVDLPPLTAFAFTTDREGRIQWAEAPVPGMLVGLSLALAATGSPGARERLAEALRRRLPLRDHPLSFAGSAAISGDWLVDATPDFDESGHFTGWLGRCRRPAPPAAAAPTEADRMRQVLHELKTPVNAIQGFAEVIQQQLFGQTPHEYRALAAGIAGDAARLLAGFDELDRWARLAAGAITPEPGSSDFAMVVAGLVHQLEHYTAGRSSGFTLDADPGELTVALDQAEAERLAWRLLASCAGFARPGETLALTLRREGSRICLVAMLPEALAEVTQPADAPTAPPAQAISAGVFGTSFTFRLLAAEAAGAGGALAFADGMVRLELPVADRSALTQSGQPTSSDASTVLHASS